MAFRVLIVDDQRDVTRMLRSTLETIEQGLEVAEAPSGEEAMLAARQQIDLLIADYRLPGMSGIELMGKIKAKHPNVKTIVITGVTDSRTKKEIEAAGVDAFMPKPVPMADFLDAVERLLGRERTILKADEPVATVHREERKTIADILVNFRQQMKAGAVILLSDRGRVVAQAGELPDPNVSPSLLSALTTVYSSAQKISLLMEHTSSADVHIFRGAVDAIFVPIGYTHALLLSGKGLASGAALSKSLDALVVAQSELEEMLKTIQTGSLSPKVVEAFESKQSASSIAQSPSANNSPVVEDDVPVDDDFLALLGGAAEKKKTDASSFWDDAVEKGPGFVLKDTLSFEEASKLGLTPDKK